MMLIEGTFCKLCKVYGETSFEGTGGLWITKPFTNWKKDVENILPSYQHILCTTNFDKLVELVVSCGGEGLKKFLDKTGGNAMYISHVAVVEFIEALGK